MNNLLLCTSNIDKYAMDVIHLLQLSHKKVAVVESCTGGMISAKLTAFSGSSTVFDMGLCAYANSIKEEILGVPADILKQYGAVSEQTAYHMAINMKRLAKADFAIATTGIAGPTGGTKEKPVGTVYIGCAYGDKTKIIHLEIKTNNTISDVRDYIRNETCRQAFILLYTCILEK